MIAQALVCRELIGRDAELAHLHERRRQASRAHGGLVLVAGEAGVGKSRLLAEFRASLAGLRVRAVASHCRQFAQRPYGPILDALAGLDPARAHLEPAPSRGEQFERIVNAFLVAARRRCVIALIEDIHWTDPASIELLAALAERAASERLLLVASYRPEASTEVSALFAGIARLANPSGTSRISLQPLAGAELRALIDGALLETQRLPSETVAAVARLSEGNPLFAEELLKSALERHCAGSSTDGLPTTIRAAVLERLEPLSAGEFEILAQAAVIGRRFGTALLEATLDAPRESVRRTLARARTLQLIVEESSDDFRFHHALTREAIYESFLGVQRRELHRRIALQLEAGDPAARAIVDLAYHWWAARDGAKAALYGERAGDEAMRVFAYDEAVRFYRYAAEFVERLSQRGAGLLAKISRAFARNGERAEALRYAIDCAEVYERLGDLQGEAEMREDWATQAANLGLGDPIAPLTALADRLRGGPNQALYARAETIRAQIFAARGACTEARAILDRLSVPGPDVDRMVRLSYFATRAILCANETDIEGYEGNVRAMLELTDESKISHRPLILCNAAKVLADAARLERAASCIDEAQSISRRLNLRAQIAVAHALDVRLRYLRGELNTARTALEAALAIGTDDANARLYIAVNGSLLARLLGDEVLLERCSHHPAGPDDGPSALIGLPRAERLAADGRTAEAANTLAAALQREDAARSPHEVYLGIARWGTASDVALARERLESFAARTQDLVHRATLPLFEALVAARSGDAAAARTHGARAADAFALIGFPLWEADARKLAGELERAKASYERIGAIARLREMERHKRLPTGTRTAQNGEVLTTRERSVAELVAQGRSNGEIADKLGVTTKAVEKHLGSIYKKLAVPSRAKLIVLLQAKGDAAD